MSSWASNMKSFPGWTPPGGSGEPMAERASSSSIQGRPGRPSPPGERRLVEVVHAHRAAADRHLAELVEHGRGGRVDVPPAEGKAEPVRDAGVRGGGGR